MEPLPTLLVLLAALMHAVWNVMVKQDRDRLLALALMSLSSGLLAALALPFVPWPAGEAWPYLGVSVVLHVAYKLFLAQGYRHGDLSQVYPIARGAAPLIVAVLAYIAAGEVLDDGQLAAVLLIALAVMSLAFARGRPAGAEARGLFYAAGTAALIAGYTVVDGIGARLSGAAAGFAAALFVAEAVGYLLVVLALRGGRALCDYGRRQWKPGLLSGALSSAAYALVVWALTIGDMALVSALRETSVIFAALLGTLILREAMGVWRLSCAAVVVLGLVLLHG
jgi:drug/metabolite transporter (DMT)-like permease